jgi:hypothetical protein
VINEYGQLDFAQVCMNRIRAYESANHGRQHLVALSAGGRQDNGFSNPEVVGKDAVIATNCDVIMPGSDKFGATWGDTDDSTGNGPPIFNFDRPWLMDMDHIEAGARRPDLFWKHFCRGYHHNHFESNSTNDPTLSQPYSTLGWQAYLDDVTYGFDIIRRNIGWITRRANTVFKNLAAMTPTDDTSVASTRYVLADAPNEYVVFFPTASDGTIQQLEVGATYDLQWYDSQQGMEAGGPQSFTAASASRGFTPPGPEHALHLWKR